MNDAGLLLRAYFSDLRNEHRMTTRFITEDDSRSFADEVVFHRTYLQDNHYAEYDFQTAFHTDNKNRNWFHYHLRRLANNKDRFVYEDYIYQIKIHLVSNTELGYKDGINHETIRIRLCLTLLGKKDRR